MSRLSKRLFQALNDRSTTMLDAMNTDPKIIGICDGCQEKIPLVFLKEVDCQPEGTINFCRICWEEKVGKLEKGSRFFSPETEGELEKLRRSIPPFPYPMTEKNVETKSWESEFATIVTRKSAWYGFNGPFEFMISALTDPDDD